jgi:predicted dehydrogenase
LANQAAGKHPSAKAYTDYAAMLADAKPDVVVVATNNVSHAPLTIQAARAGVRGIYCEKPMAESLGQARAMVEACRASGAKLAVNHQRRCMPVFRTMRKLIESGAIGKVELIVCSNAGDILSDGTHFVDTVRHLAGDADVKWVLGQVYRNAPNAAEPRGMGFQASGGWRYGHPIETGAFAVLEFANGIRTEVHSGEMIMVGKWYQHYEILGTKGRLIRRNDNSDPPISIQDEAGGWRPVEIEKPDPAMDDHAWTMQWIFRRFAEMVHTGADHPLSGDNALKDQEIVMAIYESARLHKRLTLPPSQDRYPLEIMIEQNQL